jgi:hypothetical protein
VAGVGDILAGAGSGPLALYLLTCRPIAKYIAGFFRNIDYPEEWT